MNSKKTKIILGIDPGTNILGFGIIKLENNKMKLLEHNVLSSPERLYMLKKSLFNKSLISLNLNKFIFLENHEQR